MPIDWSYDPIADVRWPDVPAHRIDHRIASADAKWIWELNRLQHLPWLAQAWLFTGDERYSRAAFEQLDSWIEQNPPGRGIAWRGAYEAGIRAISVAIALQGLRNSRLLHVERYRRIVTVLAHSASLCWRNRSLFSSANNHLVGEMAGLAVVSILFPELRHAEDWERKAIAVLSAEAEKQILPDGAGSEQSVCYQVWTAELLNLVAVLLLERDGKVPRVITEAIYRSAGYLAATTGIDGPPLRYGDDDGGFALRLGPQRVRTVRDHLRIIGALPWGTAEPCAGNDSLDAQWFSQVAADAAGDRPSPAPPAYEGQEHSGNYFAPSGGLAVLRDGRRRTTMDVGPLGYLSIAAHGHADALAITLSDGPDDLICDAGTGSYYGHPAWRTVMRGTRAHATVCVDGLDQSVQGGPFLWSRHAKVRVLGVNLENGLVDAEHDGYTRLEGRVVHRRWLVAPPGEPWQLVVDLLTGSGRHHARASWPLHPSLEVTPTARGHLVRRDGNDILSLLYAATVDVTAEEVRADTTDELGWWSDTLESRQPAWWLSASCDTSLPIAIATLLGPTDRVRAAGLEVALGPESLEVRWKEDRRCRSVSVSTRLPATVVITG